MWLGSLVAVAATAPIGPLAWEPPYAVGAALEKTKKNTVSVEYNKVKSNKIRHSRHY